MRTSARPKAEQRPLGAVRQAAKGRMARVAARRSPAGRGLPLADHGTQRAARVRTIATRGTRGARKRARAGGMRRALVGPIPLDRDPPRTRRCSRSRSRAGPGAAARSGCPPVRVTSSSAETRSAADRAGRGAPALPRAGSATMAASAAGASGRLSSPRAPLVKNRVQRIHGVPARELARSPVSISKRIAPSANRSAWPSMSPPRICPGPGIRRCPNDPGQGRKPVTRRVVVRELGDPEIQDFVAPARVRKMFSGFRSRCTDPAACAATSPRATSAPIRRTSSTARAPRPMRARARSRRRGARRRDTAGHRPVDVVEPDDVGMIERRGYVCFQHEALDPLGVSDTVGRQDLLQRDISPQPRIRGAVHLPRATATARQQDHHAVMPTMCPPPANSASSVARDRVASNEGRAFPGTQAGSRSRRPAAPLWLPGPNRSRRS